MGRRAIALLGGGLALALAVPASAAPVAPPTASATFDTVDAKEFGGPTLPSEKQPAMSAAWTVAKPGHDATLSVTGTPAPIFQGHADALWTSAPLKVVKRGQVASITLTWQAIQYDPYDHVASQKISVRFTNSKGAWGPFVTITDRSLTDPLQVPATTAQSVVVPVMYRGPVPAKALQVQVQVTDLFLYITQLQQTVRVVA